MDWDRSAKEIYHTAGVVSESKSQVRDQRMEETSVVNHRSEGVTEMDGSDPLLASLLKWI